MTLLWTLTASTPARTAKHEIHTYGGKVFLSLVLALFVQSRWSLTLDHLDVQTYIVEHSLCPDYGRCYAPAYNFLSSVSAVLILSLVNTKLHLPDSARQAAISFAK